MSAVVAQAGVPVGRFWRAADGSTRVEWTAPTAAGVTIEIRNIAERRFYTYGPVRGWTAQPMLLPTQGWTPPRVSVRAAGVRVGTTPEGYEVYERRKADGTVERRLPALNFLAAPVATAGVATALVAIEVGPAASGLFGPPAQAVVRTLSVPGGIVALPAPPPGEDR